LGESKTVLLGSGLGAGTKGPPVKTRQMSGKDSGGAPGAERPASYWTFSGGTTSIVPPAKRMSNTLQNGVGCPSSTNGRNRHLPIIVVAVRSVASPPDRTTLVDQTWPASVTQVLRMVRPSPGRLEGPPQSRQSACASIGDNILAGRLPGT
jgi:hypothetical protein